MSRPDLYELLQVTRTADPEVIDAAYKRLTFKHHPDRNRAAGAEEMMKRLNEARETLLDPIKRRLYDAMLTSPASQFGSNVNQPPVKPHSASNSSGGNGSRTLPKRPSILTCIGGLPKLALLYGGSYVGIYMASMFFGWSLPLHPAWLALMWVPLCLLYSWIQGVMGRRLMLLFGPVGDKRWMVRVSIQCAVWGISWFTVLTLASLVGAIGAIIGLVVHYGTRETPGTVKEANGVHVGQHTQTRYDRILASTVWIVTPDGTGSGFIVNEARKLVLTSSHVVGNHQRVLIVFPAWKDGRVVAERQYYVDSDRRFTGRVVDSDPLCDLALIQLEAIPLLARELPLGNSSALPGQTVHSVGNPGKSDALWVYCTGAVRQIYLKEMAYETGQRVKCRTLETQAPLNRGDSGGPVVNDGGEVVGIVASSQGDAQLISNCIDLTEIRAFVARADEASRNASWSLDNLEPSARDDNSDVPAEAVARWRLEGQFQVPLCLAFGLNDRDLAVGCRDNRVYLLRLREMRHENLNPAAGGQIAALCFQPETRSLFVGSQDGHLWRWHIGTRPVLTGHGEAHRFGMSSIACAMSSLATGGDDSRIRVWTLTAGAIELEADVVAHDGNVFAVDIARDGRFVASSGRDKTVRLWELRQKQAIQRASWSEEEVITTVSFSPDGKSLAVGGRSKHVQLWHLNGTVRTELHQLGQHAQEVKAAVFSPDGRRLASADNEGQLIIWNVSTRAMEQAWTLPSALHGLAFARDSRHIAVALADRQILILRLKRMSR